MKLYYSLIDNTIANIDSEKNEECAFELNISNMDDFYNKVKKYKCEEDIESKVKELLEDVDEEKSIESYKIKHWVSNRSFGELIDMYINGEIVKPDMQREFVWDSHKSSRLIESIILGLPIPPLFLLEVDNNEYELIDGYQRITTVTNYVSGNPWRGKDNVKRNSPAKLSGNISKELKGKTFKQLPPEYQRMIRRSTIPLIEFKQIGPDDISSKYLIFERINTGSEKLNEMQIRKSLAYGSFINSVYKMANQCEKLKKLFSVVGIKKDFHVEAFLRTYVMTEIYYNNYPLEVSGINNILNKYCEDNRNNKVRDSFVKEMNDALDIMFNIFSDEKYIFRRVEKNKNGEYCYTGSMNISILEAMLGVAIKNKLNINNANVLDIKENYNFEMSKVVDNSVNKLEDNPFSTSTGTKAAIERRFEICERILECN